eukprot:13858509-Ditylum_brightwellii.AAC.1
MEAWARSITYNNSCPTFPGAQSWCPCSHKRAKTRKYTTPLLRHLRIPRTNPTPYQLWMRANLPSNYVPELPTECQFSPTLNVLNPRDCCG